MDTNSVDTFHHIPKAGEPVGEKNATTLNMGHIGVGGPESHPHLDVVTKTRDVAPEVGVEPGAKLTGSGVCDISCSETGPRPHGNDPDDIMLFTEVGSGRTIKPADGKNPINCLTSEK